jgi:cytochrome c1
MWPDRAGIVITAVIVVLLAGATVAVYAYDTDHDQVSAAESADGRTVFLTAGCTGCHSLAGVANEGFIGPDLTGLPDRAGERVQSLSAEDYVRQSILEPVGLHRGWIRGGHAHPAPGYGRGRRSRGVPS